MPRPFRVKVLFPALLLLMMFFVYADTLRANSIITSLTCSGLLGDLGDLIGPAPICIQFITPIVPSGGGIGTFTSSQGLPSDYSPTGEVASDNAQDAPWYLTCPNDPTQEPNPTDAYYFYDPSTSSFVAGDGCLAPATDLQTTVSLITDVVVPPVTTGLEEQHNPTFIIQVEPLQVSNPGVLGLQMITYSPEVDGMLSNGFNTSSYIFSGVPSLAQHAIWSWDLGFANFANAGSQSQTYTTDAEDIEFYGGECFFSYTYTETTTLQDVMNNYLPFNEVLPNSASGGSGGLAGLLGLGGSGTVAQSTFHTEALPIIYFNYSLNLSSGVFSTNPNLTKLSEDTYSPWNYYTPANSEDQFPIDLPGVLLMANTLQSTYSCGVINTGSCKNTLLATIPENSFGIDPNAAQTPVAAYSGSQPGNIINPIAMAATDNDYIYVLYCGTPSCDVNLVTANPFSGYSGQYNIAVIRLYPQGYYNATNIPPPAPETNNFKCLASSESDCQTPWDSNWQSYWANVITEQNNEAYVVSTIQLTQAVNQKESGYFIPFNISADDEGDVFIVGGFASSVGATPQTQLVRVSNVLINGAVCNSASNSQCNSVAYSQLEQGPVQQLLSNGELFSEVAATPSLGNVYLASPNSGVIAVYSGNTLKPTNLIPLTYGQYPPGQLGYSFSLLSGSTTPPAPTAVLNIDQWLSTSGPFGVPITGLTGSVSSSSNFDSDSYHHPAAIAAVGAYLYVLDDWQGSAGGQDFNMLVLRALNATGADIPINPQYNSDVWVSNQCSASGLSYGPYSQGGSTQYIGATAQGGQGTCFTAPPPSSDCNSACTPIPSFWSCSASTGGYGNEYYCASSADQQGNYYALASSGVYPNTMNYPPYGWILSATVGSTTFCSATSGSGSVKCTYNPSNLPGSKNVPLGPELVASACQTGLGSLNPFSSCVTTCGTSFLGIGVSSQSCAGNVDLFADSNGTVTVFVPSTGKEGTDYGELLFARFNPYNYTRPFNGTPVYNCYIASSLVSSGAGGCKADDGVSGISSPVALVEDPFRYLENQGSEKLFSYQSQFNTEFTSGTGAPQSQSSQSCAAEAANFVTPTDCLPSQQGGSIDITAGLQTPPTTQAQNIANTPTNTPVLSSLLSGEGFVPYKYTYQTKETFTDFHLVQEICPPHEPDCCPTTVPDITPDPITTTVYSYASTAKDASSPLSANVEGGGTYLNYQGTNNNWYIQNLSDIGLYLSQHVLINISDDRSFGRILVMNASAGSSKYNLLNATQRLRYAINTFNNGPLAYETIGSQLYGQYYGPSYSGTTLQSKSNLVANFIYMQTFSYVPHFTGVPLLNWYKQEVYLSPLDLWIPQLTGYQRLMYVMNDRFNNTIYVPIDADIANNTQVSLDVSPSVNVINPNQTVLYISGNVGYLSYNNFDSFNSFFVPLPEGQVYLYYGKNLNYQGLSQEQEQLCAFGSPLYPYNTVPFPANCILSNPEYTGISAGAEIPSYITSNSGVCPAPPNSLIYGTSVNCNIYGNDGNGWMGSPSCSTNGATCVPIFVNGSGVCTTQQGLMSIVTTNALGDFSYNDIVCGIGQATITAKFYGKPTTPLEPITVYQGPLTASANGIYPKFPAVSSSGTFNGIAFTWAPNQTIAISEIGLFELGFGDIGGFAIITGVAIALLILLYRNTSKTKK